MSRPAESTPSPVRARLVWSFIVAGFGAQLAAAYFDNVRGPLMPPMARELGLEFTQSGLFLTVCQIAATLATLTMIGALNRFSERAVLIVVCAVAVAAGLAAPVVTGFGGLLAFAVLLGSSISALGTMSNVMIVEGSPPHLQTRVMAGLHSMYGFGSMFAAAVVGWGLASGVRWATLYAAAAPVFALLGLAAALRMPSRRLRGERTVQPASLNKAQTLVVVTFAVYVAGEVTASMWLTSFLVSEHGLAVSDATPYVTGLFLVMALSRLGCAAFMRERFEPLVLRLALILPVAAFLTGYFGHVTGAFMLMGLFGPFFPVMLARQSRRFPDRWRSVTIWVMVAMSVSIGTCNLLLGREADVIGLHAAYLLPPILLATALVMVHFILRSERP